MSKKKKKSKLDINALSAHSKILQLGGIHDADLLLLVPEVAITSRRLLKFTK